MMDFIVSEDDMELFVSEYYFHVFFYYAKGKSQLWFMWGYNHFFALQGVFLCVF